MAKDMFDISAPDLINLRKFFKRAPKQFFRASALFLNEMGFGVRKNIFFILDDEMEIRNERFVKSKVRVDMAKGTQPTTSQSVEVGSIFGPRFTGWGEQELGKKTARTRVPTLFARGGDPGKQVRPASRFKLGNRFRSPADVRGNDDHHRAVVFLNITSREGFKKPFMIFGHDDVPDGLYKWQRKNKLRMVQELNSDKTQPKRFKWMSKATSKFFSTFNVPKTWEKVLNKVLK